MLKPNCPPGTKPKDAKDIPQIASDPAVQDWFARNHGRDVEAPTPKFEEVEAHWRRFVAGLTRQYEFLGQGGRWQRVRASLDNLKNINSTSEMKALNRMHDAFRGLNAKQKHESGFVLLARDLDEEVRRQRQELVDRETLRFQARRAKQEKALERQRKLLEENLKKAKADQAKIDKRLEIFDRRATARFQKADTALQARLQRRQGQLPIVDALRREGMDLGSVASMVADADRITKQDPAVSAAVTMRRDYLTKLTDERKSLQKEVFGFEPDLSRDDYVHHEILRRVTQQAATVGGGKLAGRSVLRSFYTIHRKGTSLAYNTSFHEAEGRVLKQMVADNERLRALKELKAHDIGPRLVAQALAEAKAGGTYKPGEKVNIDHLIPETHGRFSPEKGTEISQFWEAQGRYLERLEQAAYDRMGLTPGQNKQDLYITHLQDWILPKELIETTKAVIKPFDPTHEAFVNRILRNTMGAWKRSRLYMPWTLLRYELGNFSGDTDAAYRYTSPRRHPNITRLFVTRAVPEVSGHLFGRKDATPEYRAFLERAGTDSAQLRAELGIEQLDATARARLARALQQPNVIRKFAAGATQTAWEAGRAYLNQVFRFDGAREHLWRFTLFMDYLDQMTKSPDGRPKDYGTSIPDEVLAYDNLFDRAFHLSNDTMGAYDKTTAAGRWLADHLFPFWRFQEINHRRAYRYLANQVRDVPEAAAAGQRVLVKLGLAAKATPLALARLGFFAAKMAALEAALTAYNYSMYPDAMESLDDKDRQRPLLITGYDPRTGRVEYIGRLGAVPDFLAMFGLFDNYKFAASWLNGEISSEQALKRMAEKTKETASQMFGPLRTFSDLFRGVQQIRGGELRPVRDKTDKAIGELLGPWAQRTYRSLMKIPQPPFDLKRFAVTVADTEEQSYYHTLDRLGDFKQKMRLGGEAGGGPFTARQNALYWHRAARRYNDEELARRYALEYISEGGTPESYAATVRALSPIGNLTQPQLEKWLATLEPRERRGVLRGMQHWADLVAPGFEVPREVGKDLAIDLLVLRGQILGEAQLAAMEEKGVIGTLLSEPGAIDTMVEAGMKKKGME